MPNESNGALRPGSMFTASVPHGAHVSAATHAREFTVERVTPSGVIYAHAKGLRPRRFRVTGDQVVEIVRKGDPPPYSGTIADAADPDPVP